MIRSLIHWTNTGPVSETINQHRVESVESSLRDTQRVDKCNIYPLDTVDVCIPTQDFHIKVPLRQRFLASRPTSSLCQFHLSMSSTVEATLETDWHARSLWFCQLVHQLSRRRWSLEQRYIILWRALSRRSTARMFHGMHDENCM